MFLSYAVTELVIPSCPPGLAWDAEKWGTNFCEIWYWIVHFLLRHFFTKTYTCYGVDLEHKILNVWGYFFFTLSGIPIDGQRKPKKKQWCHGCRTLDRVQNPSNPKCHKSLQSALNIYFEHKLCRGSKHNNIFRYEGIYRTYARHTFVQFILRLKLSVIGLLCNTIRYSRKP